ncbi:MAG: hypothetical protein SD837_07365 [Candidatus Electrothrix scaldis]|nr:MAG: hypothetical protein SD837_07365 [Candidatus Electrothrix sp. GW3-3]
MMRCALNAEAKREVMPGRMEDAIYLNIISPICQGLIWMNCCVAASHNFVKPVKLVRTYSPAGEYSHCFV